MPFARPETSQEKNALAYLNAHPEYKPFEAPAEDLSSADDAKKKAAAEYLTQLINAVKELKINIQTLKKDKTAAVPILSRLSEQDKKSDAYLFLVDHFNNYAPVVKAKKDVADSAKKGSDLHIGVTSVAPPKVNTAETFNKIWNQHLTEDIRTKYETTFVNGKDTAAGFTVKSTAALADEPVMKVTPTEASLKEGDWATNDEKAKLMVAGLLAQGIDPAKNVLTINCEDKGLADAVKKELAAKDFKHVKDATPTANAGVNAGQNTQEKKDTLSPFTPGHGTGTGI